MLDQLTRSILQLLPSDTSEELKNNIDALVQGRFEQMNLATREQLEIQEKILRRTKERLLRLEQQVEELENKLKPM
jgi:BMFP domain-containing protein YqiC